MFWELYNKDGALTSEDTTNVGSGSTDDSDMGALYDLFVAVLVA